MEKNPMELNGIFEIIKKSFSNVFNNFSTLSIQNELDWQKHLYIELKKNFGELDSKKLFVHLEAGSFKHGNNILWISPNKYGKKQKLVDEFFNVNTDPGGHYKINLNNSKKPLTQEIKKFIDTERNRWYYVDIVIYDNEVQQTLAYIELKCEDGLSDDPVVSDYWKLKRLESVRNFEAIYIAAGYDPKNEKVIWMPTNSKYKYEFKILPSYSNLSLENTPIEFLNTSELVTKLKEISKNLYESVHASEALWNGEIMFALKPYLPSAWRINSEVTPPNNISGKIDIGIFDENKNLHTAIEIKSHFEQPFPVEILNGLNNDSLLQDDFYSKVFAFIAEYNLNNKVLTTRSSFPKNKDKYYLNADFFEKIIETYAQYKRMSELIQIKKIKQGIMIYIDHNDDYTLRKNRDNIPEQIFLNNFKFRESLMQKILKSVYNEDCHFIYMYKLNGKNDTKRLFFIDD